MSIAFFSPLRLNDNADSGSKVRPLRIMRSLRENGCDVSLLTGTSAERKKLWSEYPDRGLDKLYGELSTMPLALTDPDHIPRRPLMDMKHFRKLRQSGVPVGIFYRDVLWRFPKYKEDVGIFKRWAAWFFYYVELYQISRSVSHLFLPSLRMASYIPIRFPEERISALPPGAQIRSSEGRRFDRLELFYVGGVEPPLYDLSPMFLALTRVPSASLTVCCRRWEWERVKDLYSIPNNVTVVHDSGDGLEKHFVKANVFLMFRNMTEYLKFAMPVKLFEAIGAGLPVITNGDCEMGDFVQRENVGWTLNDSTELESLVSELAADLTKVRDFGKHTMEVRWRHTWDARAREIVDVLARYQEGGRT